MEMDEITYRRLANQEVSHQRFNCPGDLVKWMIALQAQDYPASLWAVGVRVPESSNITETDIEQAIADRKIVRTWPMRGTLHLVAAEDARWMLNLMTPRVIKSSRTRRRELELDDTSLRKSQQLVEKHLRDGKSLTRSELYAILEKGGISTAGQRGYHIIWYLAQNAVICCGARRGKQHTFVLFDEWIAESRQLNENEALAELAERYIRSRGPVTEYDFAYWSGLKVTTARKAFHIVENQFDKFETGGQTYWFPGQNNPGPESSGGTWLLPGFDEMICSYKDRSAIMKSDQTKSIILKNGILKPVIISGSKAVGTWNRTIKKNSVSIGIEPFETLTEQQKTEIQDKKLQYSNFLSLIRE